MRSHRKLTVRGDAKGLFLRSGGKVYRHPEHILMDDGTLKPVRGNYAEMAPGQKVDVSTVEYGMGDLTVFHPVPDGSGRGHYLQWKEEP